MKVWELLTDGKELQEIGRMIEFLIGMVAVIPILIYFIVDDIGIL